MKNHEWLCGCVAVAASLPPLFFLRGSPAGGDLCGCHTRGALGRILFGKEELIMIYDDEEMMIYDDDDE